MRITRRVFLRNGALAVVGTAAVPDFLARALASDTRFAGKRLVVIFQRGAADGLNMVVPHGEAAYYKMRPSIAIPRPRAGTASALDLDGFFGLHPAMAPLKPLWDAKRLAIVPAAGSPDNTRSHFDAQDYMESGTPGIKSTPDGWLNRALREAGEREEHSPFRAVAMSGTMPRILSGPMPAVAMDRVEQFAVGGGAQAGQTFESLYAGSVDTLLHGSGRDTFEAVRMLRSADPARYRPRAGASYPRGRFAQSLMQLAQLMKAGLGVQIAFADIGGWDHHVNEGGVQGPLANLLREFAQSIAAFWTDLGDLAGETVLVTLSEFGRTARENGNRGTDHGHGNVILALGGPVRGGRIYGRWPGLGGDQLYEGRDLDITTDFRQVLGEVIARHGGHRDLDSVFPRFDNGAHRFPGLLG